MGDTVVWDRPFSAPEKGAVLFGKGPPLVQSFPVEKEHAGLTFSVSYEASGGGGRVIACCERPSQTAIAHWQEVAGAHYCLGRLRAAR
jgi:hypothetical protein